MDMEAYKKSILTRISSLSIEIQNAGEDKKLVRKLKNKQSAYKARLGKRECDMTNEKKLEQSKNVIKAMFDSLQSQLSRTQLSELEKVVKEAEPGFDLEKVIKKE